MSKKLFLLLFFLVPLIYSGFSQNKDSLRVIPEPTFRNVIKLNPTPMMLWHKKNVTLSYERVLNPKQSFTVGLGYLVFNNLLDDTILSVISINTRKKYGLNFSFEYRFYLTNRNSRPVPDGLYLAPFFTTYLYHFENGLEYTGPEGQEFAQLTGGFYAFNAGAALGYQFVLWKRLSIDLILIGPAVSYYGGKVNVKGELGLEKIKELNEELYDKILEKYPQADGILVDKTFEKKGKVDLLSLGYRYVLQIGFLF